MAKQTRFLPGNTAGLVHGAAGVRKRGPDALPVELQDDYKQMLANLGTHEGVLCELERQVGYNLAIATAGFAYLQRKAEQGINVWESGPDHTPEPVLKYLGSWANGAIRALTALANLRQDQGTIDLAQSMTKARQELDDKGHENG